MNTTEKLLRQVLETAVRLCPRYKYASDEEQAEALASWMCCYGGDATWELIEVYGDSLKDEILLALVVP
jgi:hypothetical protein